MPSPALCSLSVRVRGTGKVSEARGPWAPGPHPVLYRTNTAGLTQIQTLPDSVLICFVVVVSCCFCLFWNGFALFWHFCQQISVSVFVYVSADTLHVFEFILVVFVCLYLFCCHPTCFVVALHISVTCMFLYIMLFSWLCDAHYVSNLPVITFPHFVSHHIHFCLFVVILLLACFCSSLPSCFQVACVCISFVCWSFMTLWLFCVFPVFLFVLLLIWFELCVAAVGLQLNSLLVLTCCWTVTAQYST